MNGAQHSRIVNFIWGIADDVLRDLYVRGKYRDVILPMTVLRRLDAVLEPTKEAVLDMKAIARQSRASPTRTQPLREAAGQAFYNTSKFTLRDLRSRASQQQLTVGLRGLPRRLLAERAGDPRQLRVPQPDPAALQGRRARRADREVPRPDDQPQPEPVLNGDGSVKHPASTTTPWARSSRSSSAASTRRTTRKPASTGRRATR